MNSALSKKALAVGLLIFSCIFLGILYGCVEPEFQSGDIATITKQMLQERSDPGALDTSTYGYFRAGTNLTPMALVGNSGLAPEQICLHKGDLRDNNALEVKGESIMNKGTTDLTVKVSIMCNKANALEDALKEVGFEGIELNSEYGTCDCDLTSTLQCCVVILRYA